MRFNFTPLRHIKRLRHSTFTPKGGAKVGIFLPNSANLIVKNKYQNQTTMKNHIYASVRNRLLTRKSINVMDM